LAADLLIRSLQNDDSITTHSHSHQQANATNEERRESATKENGTKATAPKVHINRSTVILNLAADALHNFTDGLAIGATYSTTKTTADLSTLSSQQATLTSVWSVLRTHSRGGLATISIAFHEIPHELGDVCTLIRAGYSKRQAIASQLLTAIGAFCGTATAIAVSDYEALVEERLLWITAGGFVYLACTTILPDVLSEKGGSNSSSLFPIAQLAAFCAGIAFLYAVALLEEADHTSDGADHHHRHHHHRAEGHHHQHTEL